jgi:hypothetical protein
LPRERSERRGAEFHTKFNRRKLRLDKCEKTMSIMP